MRVERGPVFETNSSSTHSISIVGGDYIVDRLPVEDGICTIYGCQFGWEYEVYSDAAMKASYAATYAVLYGSDSHQEMLRRVVSDETRAEEVRFEVSDDYDSPHWSYIDHQSIEAGVPQSAFENAAVLRNFIFNPRSTLTTDNDNH